MIKFEGLFIEPPCDPIRVRKEAVSYWSWLAVSHLPIDLGRVIQSGPE